MVLKARTSPPLLTAIDQAAAPRLSGKSTTPTRSQWLDAQSRTRHIDHARESLNK